MGYYCVMVHGPCRGRLCDYWARVRLRKSSIEDLVASIHESICECNTDVGLSSEDILDRFWKTLGIKSIDRLCDEDPGLCEKIAQVRQEFLN